MSLTTAQIEQIAKAICGILRIKELGWPNPYVLRLSPDQVPADSVEAADEESRNDTSFGFAFRPGGPLEKDVRWGELEVAIDDRGCFYRIVVAGRRKESGGYKLWKWYGDWTAP